MADAFAAARPNIVFFLADDLGQRDIGVYGSTFYETPNIDRLAREGALFTDGYAACPVCSPTRASILTGQWLQAYDPAQPGVRVSPRPTEKDHRQREATRQQRKPRQKNKAS